MTTVNFCIEASTSNPETRQGYERGNLADYTVTTYRPEVIRSANYFLWRGYWVEIYNDDTKELLAGPFDPDSPLPTIVL